MISGVAETTFLPFTRQGTPGYFSACQAKLIKAGSDLVFQMHYTANGKTAADRRTSVGLIFAKEPPAERVLTISSDE